MRAMVLSSSGVGLELQEVPRPSPKPEQLLLRIHACAVCRTDLHIVDRELPNPKPSLILGHQFVATVEEAGAAARGFPIGTRVGVPWLGWADGVCKYCVSGRENLCDNARFTGYDLDGGYAEYAVADYRFCFPVPAGFDDPHAAPLLCAGLIGFRSYRLAGDARRIGFYGFGSAAHILIQVARHEGREVYAFVRPGDVEGQRIATQLGAVWAGGSDQKPPEELDAAIIFAPVGSLVPAALAAVAKGGSVVCGGIHMSDIPSFPYKLLWEERVLRSVANLTRKDGVEFLALAPKVPIQTQVQRFPLDQANAALEAVRKGHIDGSAVLTP